MNCLKCSTNNRADTVLQAFVNATLTVPQKIRTDMEVKMLTLGIYYMMQQHGNKRCVIVRNSVHSQRIETLLREVHRADLKSYS